MTHNFYPVILAILDNLINRQRTGFPQNLLKNKKWLITEDNREVAPSQVLYVPGIENEVKNLLSQLEETDKGWITVSQLHPDIRPNEKVMGWLQDNLFIKGQAALEIIGKKASKLPSYSLGEFETNSFPLTEALAIFPDEILPCWKLVKGLQLLDKRSIPSNYEILPCWGLVKGLRSLKDRINFINSYLLKPMEEQQLIDLLNWISCHHTSPDTNTVKLYNHYLSLAIERTEFKSKVLPKICLLNRCRKWQDPRQLCVSISNINEQHILDEDQERILQDYLQAVSIADQQSSIIPTQSGNNRSNYQILEEYFADWKMYVYTEAIGVFLCLIAGEDEFVTQLAQTFLRNKDLNLLRKSLLDQVSPRSFSISISNLIQQQVPSLIRGINFEAQINSNSKIDSNILVNELNINTTQLTLLPITDLSRYSKSDLSKKLKNSVKVLLKRVYKVENIDDRLEKIWGNLTKTDQLDFEVTKQVIFKSAPYIIRFLGVHNQNEQIKRILDEWNKAIHDLEEYRTYYGDYTVIDQNINNLGQNLDLFLFLEDDDSANTSSLVSNSNKLGEKINNLKKQLDQLLEDDSSTNTASLHFLNAVRKKIESFGYQLQSIPFEIFQNADDALVELDLMAQGKTLSPNRLKFILEVVNNTITMMYWGRPINCFRHPDYPLNDFRDQGFGQDLEKMLSFNYSDKSSSDSSVTGKFGLGFKSVHLICDQPHVFSNRIAFKIVNGLVPSKLIPTRTNELQKQLQSHNPEILDGTAIALTFDPNLNLSADDILREFKRLAGFLLIFSKKIKEINITRQDTITWHPEHLFGQNTIQIGIIRINQESINVLCLKLEERGHFVIAVKETSEGLKSSLPTDIPNIWVTAPTQEPNFGLNFIINSAEFQVNVGQSNLTYNNSELAQELGELLGKQLCLLFDEINADWDKFKEKLKLSKTTLYKFWQFIWEQLAVSWLNKEKQETLALIKEMLGGQKGMGYFVNKRTALPNGLWGDYQQLVRPRDICYIIDGILKKEIYLTRVFQWDEVQKECKKEQVILASIWEPYKILLNSPLSKNHFKNNKLPQTLNILSCLQWKLSNSTADTQIAQQVGELLENIKQNDISEYQGLISWLGKIELLSEDDQYKLSKFLLDPKSQNLKEKLLSGFAEKNYILHHDYKNQGLQFFYACRQQEKPTFNIEEAKVIEWINLIQPADLNRQEAVKDYLKYLKLENSRSFTELIKKLEQFSWLRDWLVYLESTNSPESQRSENLEQPENDIDQTKQDGKGDPEWGEPGEKLAELFYKQIYNEPNYKLDYIGDIYDYLLTKDGQKFKIIEVKAISSKSIRLPVFEWNQLITENKFYELFIVEHSGGNVDRVIRVKNVWKTLKQAFENLGLQYPTSEIKNIESLIGLQKDSSNENIIILNWKRFVDYYKERSGDENIMIYSCSAVLIKGKPEAELLEIFQHKH